MKQVLSSVGFWVALVVLAMAGGNVARAEAPLSVSRIAFGPANVLFLADWKAGKVHAYELPPAVASDGKPFNLTDLDKPLRAACGDKEFDLKDMSARPGSAEVYIAVTTRPEQRPEVIAVTADGTVVRLDLGKLKATDVELSDTLADDVKVWGNIPTRSFTVTDMAWHGGKLYAAGMSNQAFSSVLRVTPYPFTGRATVASVSMYHTAHDQTETRAPIRAMTFADLGGKTHLLAAYVCTPLVTIPLDDIKDGASIKAKTIAELGDAGTPVKILTYNRTDMGTGKPLPSVLVVNQFRESSLMSLGEVATASAGAGLTKPVAFGKKAGLEMEAAPLSTVFRMDNQDDKFLVAVRRDMVSGRTQLVSYNKMAGFRLSDYDMSEFLAPGYVYKGAGPEQIKAMQNMLKTQEGFPGEVRK